ncbi:MAG: bifunctional [glutamate--ammonia ligase]-adenylyl-L-tyrosine phosphorylase/[glutamate--ammonia-ligase] adenylyltransferase [Ruminobacter sp.]|nr:bifunctional [glutamate--ammonia ligase]-adenylyl-L-tyrosine phosphorylase/[glutamate--ammonia-ligase] adenylyltransferase [Ruminobacter sp.]
MTITLKMQEQADKSFNRLLSLAKSEEDKSLFLENESNLKEIFGLSDFVATALTRDLSIARNLLQKDALEKVYPEEGFRSYIKNLISNCKDLNSLKKVLRVYRNEVFAKVTWLDMTNRLPLGECFKIMSDFAESIIVETLDYLYKSHTALYGVPSSYEGTPQKMLVIGMGKLGGRELNFSSDIDLIFCYPEIGETVGSRKSIDNQVFFTRLGQALIQVLDQKTVDGQVYRVDMRLRPFGESGPLVSSFASLEDYYLKHGRSWERYAMVKGRVLGDETKEAKELNDMLRPFVFRRYLDFSAIESLRKMKSMIEAEVRRRHLRDNIKLGKGGIRELEFIAQVFQLMRGGRVLALQEKHLLKVLEHLKECNLLDDKTYETLNDCYIFLRRTENLLQEINDEQNQTLPDKEIDKDRLVSVLGFNSYDDFYQKFNSVLECVNSEFKLIIRDPEDEEINSSEDNSYLDLWLLPLSLEEMKSALESNFSNKEELDKFSQTLIRFKNNCKSKQIGPKGREILNKLVPYLLFKLVNENKPSISLGRITQLLLQIVTRTTYLQLITENVGVCDQLIKLCSGSQLITEQLTEHPILLDELIMPKTLYTPTDPKDYPHELREFLLRVSSNDLEQQMESLRQFKQIQLLRICASDLVGHLPLMKVSDYLTYLAQAILNEVVNLTWNQLVAKHGIPSNAIKYGDKGICVIGYGKLGGIELAYGSDLDLVFLCDSDLDGETNGEQVISNRMFYGRFAQRLMHLFSTRLSSGILYEVDARLRPEGAAGPLICTLSGYEQYLENKAWTWELQALVRARAVLGSERLINKFNEIRNNIIRKNRNDEDLLKDVIEMRNKMRANLIRGTKETFDIKQGFGGMTDIEFMGQYLVLKYASKLQDMVLWSDNVRIFEEMARLEIIPEFVAKGLIKAYLALRNMYHHTSLQVLPRYVSLDVLASEREFVQKVWNSLMLDSGDIKEIKPLE